MAVRLAVADLTCTYEVPGLAPVHAISGLTHTFAAGGLTVLAGPSGSGKSALLRLLAGLEAPTGGVVERVAGRVAYLPQRLEIAPALTVQDLIARSAAEPVAEHVARIARTLDLTLLLDRPCGTLSGGEYRRAALAAVLAQEPELLLLDEPLADLDGHARMQLRMDLAEWQSLRGATVVWATHDQDEAMLLATELLVLSEGRLIQAGPPAQLYDRPATAMVAGFIGAPPMNLISGQLVTGDGGLWVEGGALGLRLPAESSLAYAEYTGQPVTMGVRPEDIHLAGPEDDPTHCTWVVPRLVRRAGSDLLVSFPTGLSTSIVRVRPGSDVAPGQPVLLKLDVERIHLFDPVTGSVIAAN